MQDEDTGKGKSEIYSCSATQDFIDKLDSAARKMGWSRALLVRTLVNRHMDLVVNDRDEEPVISWVNKQKEIPIILRVPSKLQGDPEGLRAWLGVKMEYLEKKLGHVNGNATPAQ